MMRLAEAPLQRTGVRSACRDRSASGMRLAVTALGPCYCKPTQSGAYLHFAEVAGATSLPIMLYNIPIFMGFNLERETLGRLVKAFGSNGRLNPIPLWKAAMNLCGLRVGPPRLPLAPSAPRSP